MMAKPSVLPGAEPSWWLQEACAAEGNVESSPPLRGDEQADVAIVGGGYTGLWTALALRRRRPQLSIALLEAEIAGAGASGKNGGIVHGYWSSLPHAVTACGDEGALEVARLGTVAQQGIRDFVTRCPWDLWWRESGVIKVSTTQRQDAKLAQYVETAKRLGVSDTAMPLSPAQVQARCDSPVFLGGILFPEGATIQPARLARALRKAALDAGVHIYERTPMVSLQAGVTNTVATPHGRLRAPQVVLASNAALTGRRGLREHLTNFSSYMVLTEPVPELLRELGWTGGEGISDGRMFLHYFRTTADGRVAMGSGSGPIGPGGRMDASRFTADAASAARAEAGLRRIFPALAQVRITHAWGGAIDVSADGLPFFGTLPGTQIHYGCGYSGHGVNPTYIGGECLASLVVGARDRWTASPFCARSVPRYPPEPFRYLGGQAIRAAILSCEAADENGRPAPLLARIGAAIPTALHLRIGTR